MGEHILGLGAILSTLHILTGIRAFTNNFFDIGTHLFSRVNTSGAVINKMMSNVCIKISSSSFLHYFVLRYMVKILALFFTFHHIRKNQQM
jgi:hypothetical protein